jgi:hypothetical protein
VRLLGGEIIRRDGDSANGMVMDFSDVSQEPQITLSYAEASADQGYFVYRSFNSANTGTNLTLRFLEIRTNSVLIRIKDSGEQIQLDLRAK